MRPTISSMLLPALCTIWGIQQDTDHTYWATAAHCLPPVGQTVILASPTGDGTRVQARVISRDAETDTGVVMTWTRDVGPIAPAALAQPRPGDATIHSRRTDIPATITDDTLHVPGLTDRSIARAKVVPGDSGSPITQPDGVVGVVSHSVAGCQTGFCPTPLDAVKAGAAQPLLAGDPLGITMRDLIAAIAGWFGIKWWTNRTPPK